MLYLNLSLSVRVSTGCKAIFPSWTVLPATAITYPGSVVLSFTASTIVCLLCTLMLAAQLELHPQRHVHCFFMSLAQREKHSPELCPPLPVRRSKRGRDAPKSHPVTLVPASSLQSALPKALFPVTVWHIYFRSQMQRIATYHRERETDSHQGSRVLEQCGVNDMPLRFRGGGPDCFLIPLPSW